MWSNIQNVPCGMTQLWSWWWDDILCIELYVSSWGKIFFFFLEQENKKTRSYGAGICIHTNKWMLGFVILFKLIKYYVRYIYVGIYFWIPASYIFIYLLLHVIPLLHIYCYMYVYIFMCVCCNRASSSFMYLCKHIAWYISNFTY